MKNPSPGQTCTTPAADQVAGEAPAPGRAWLTAARVTLTELQPVIAEIVPMILGFPAS